jgi:hypothetical protein
MESTDEFTEGYIRRFLTTLYIARRRRHLKALADLYGWSPEALAEAEDRFIKTAECVPRFDPIS